MDERKQAVDMIRHIVAAFGLSGKEIAEILGIPYSQGSENTQEPPTAPKWVKTFLQDVAGIPKELADTATVVGVGKNHISLNIEGTEAQKNIEAKTKTIPKLREEMETVIDYARDCFLKSSGCADARGFNPECLSSLMMAYRSAIELASWGEEDSTEDEREG